MLNLYTRDFEYFSKSFKVRLPFLLFNIMLYSMFIIFNIISSLRFLPFEIMSHLVVLHLTLFPVVVFYFYLHSYVLSSLFIMRHFVLSTFVNYLTFFSVDILSHLTFCPSNFFKVGVFFYFDVLSVNRIQATIRKQDPSRPWRNIKRHFELQLLQSSRYGENLPPEPKILSTLKWQLGRKCKCKASK
jgi:hypothetical protein